MERYESLGLVGEGSYGTVLKCRHRDSGRLVAIKKFMDSDDDKTVKKIALREIKLLRQLRHDNLVNLLEVWKRRRRWYLVFEFVERTLLDDLEKNPSGLDLNTSRRYLYQILRAAAFCHQQHIIHRDIKPENILVSQGGVVKLCDFGFARTVTLPAEEGVYTDYVATRWYRAPELLVGDTKYGKPVDVWAVGCLSIEMLTGQPLFPGNSDLDQIYHIIRCFGNLTAHHQELFYRNPVFSGVRLPECSGRIPLEQRFPTIPTPALDLTQSCLQMDPERRAQCSKLLEDPLFTQDSFHIRVLEELNAKIQKDHRENSTLPKIAKTSRLEKNELDVKNQKGKEKKQSEDVDRKVAKEKEKRNKEGKEEKMPKTKWKKTSKAPKIVLNTSENPISTKQSKILGRKIIDNAAKATAAMRSKPGKAIDSELRKEAEISKPTKIVTSDSLKTSKTATDLKDNNTVRAKPKYAKLSPQPRKGHSKNMDTKGTDSTGLHSSCPDNTVSSLTEKDVLGNWRSSKSDCGQDFGSCSNSNASKFSENSTTDHSNKSSSPKDYLKSTIEPTDINLTEKISEISTAEYPEGAATAAPSEILNTGQVETSLKLNASHPSSNDHVEVATPTIPSVAKQVKTTMQVLPSNPKPARTTSNSGSKMSKTNMPLFISPSNTFTSDLSAQSSTVFREATPVASTTKLPKGTFQAGSSKAKNYTTCVANKPSRELPAGKEHTEVFIATKNQQNSWNTSNRVFRGDHGCLNISPVTKTPANHIEIFDVSGCDYKENPESCDHCSIHQQSTTESRRTSKSMTSQILKTNMSGGTTIQKTMEVSDKESGEDFFEAIRATTKSVVNQTSEDTEQKKNTSEGEPNAKSSKPLQYKCLIGEPKTKLGSYSNHTKSIATQKTKISTEASKKRDNLEIYNAANISPKTDSTSCTLTANPDCKALTRSSVFHNTADINQFDFSLPHSCPPPPPVSSSLLFLPPSSTPPIPSSSVVPTNCPATKDHLTLGLGFHPGTHSLRCVDKLMNRGGVRSRLAEESLSSHTAGPLTPQASERSLFGGRSFLSDCCNHSNTDSITATQINSDSFPDLRSPALPELRGREGKPTTGTSKDQRKDKQPVPFIPPSEPQQHEGNSADST